MPPADCMPLYIVPDDIFQMLMEDANGFYKPSNWKGRSELFDIRSDPPSPHERHRPIHQIRYKDGKLFTPLPGKIGWIEVLSWSTYQALKCGGDKS